MQHPENALVCCSGRVSLHLTNWTESLIFRYFADKRPKNWTFSLIFMLFENCTSLPFEYRASLVFGSHCNSICTVLRVIFLRSPICTGDTNIEHSNFGNI